ncbi:MAG: YceI family protein [Algoriphagus sp.]|nr:YceI family protein [Algoriphagus sp.]
MKGVGFILALFLSFSALGQEFLTKNGEVVFLSEAPLNEFEGKSSFLNGLINLDKNLLDFFIDLNTLKTGISLRDSHMRENYFETDQYPFAEFTGKIAQAPKLVVGERTSVKALGAFKMHGVERQIEVTGFLTKLQNGKIELSADFTIKLSDYKISIPSLIFYELAEEQKVTIKATLTEKK